MCSNLSSLSVQVTEEVVKSKLLDKINKETGENLSLLDLIGTLESYKSILFYLIDFKRPVITCLKESNLLTQEIFYKYQYIFDSLNINSPKPTKQARMGYGYCPFDGKLFDYSFEFIDNNIDDVNWSWVSSFEYLDWNQELLLKYRDYLIFSVEKGHFQKFGRNKIGKRFSVLNGIGSPKAYKNLSGSISLSKTIEWSKELIQNLNEYWDWTELSLNDSVPWDSDMISTFYNKIDFDVLSGNESVQFTEELIETYKDQWNWKKLSGNSSLPWSKDFIEKYQEKWVWIPTWGDNYFFEKSYPQPCISRNKGIYWDAELISNYRKLIDLWRVAEHGSISDRAIIDYSDEFDRNEKVGSRYCKYSDWRADEDLYSNGWQNLSLNPNFCISKENVEFYYNRYTTITYTEGNLAHDGYYVSPKIRVLDLIKECPVTGIGVNDLIENRGKWSEVLVNKNFINPSIWDNILKPLFSDQFLSDFFQLLKNQNK